MHLCKCGEGISNERFKLNIKVCLKCGAKAAAEEIKAKQSRVAVAYNKGGLQYMGAADVAAANLRNTMGAQGRSVVNIQDDQRISGTLPFIGSVTGRVECRDPKPSNPPRRGPKPVGVAWVNGQAYFIYSRNDPRIQKASRHAFYGQ